MPTEFAFFCACIFFCLFSLGFLYAGGTSNQKWAAPFEAFCSFSVQAQTISLTYYLGMEFISPILFPDCPELFLNDHTTLWKRSHSYETRTAGNIWKLHNWAFSSNVSHPLLVVIGLYFCLRGEEKIFWEKDAQLINTFSTAFPLPKIKKIARVWGFFFPQKCMTAAFLLWELCTLISWGCTGKQIVNLCHTFIFFFCNTSAPPKPPAHKCLGALKIRFGRTKKLPLMTILDRWMQLWFC